MNRKPFFIAVTLLALAAISAGASVATAQAPQLTSGTIAYPGTLSDDTGQPVPDGAYDFTFALFNASEGGNLLWSETQSGVVVQNGVFTALLGSVSPLPQEIQASGGYWLAVGVRGPGEAEFTALNQRQELSEGSTSTTAGATCSHNHFGETWTGTGLGLSLQSIGVGGETLYVNTTGNYDGVRAYSNATEPNDAALKGINLSTGSGVFGSSTSGIGVYGEAPNAVVGISTSPGYAAVFGENDTSNSSGVYGTSTSGVGVRANNSSSTGTALSISKGAFRVEGAGVGTSTTVFIHQVVTGAGGNICTGLVNTTVINHPLTNGDPNAILIITVNGGTMGSLKAPDGVVVVSYDATNMCGFGGRWLISNIGTYHALPDGAKFNVMVVKP